MHNPLVVVDVLRWRMYLRVRNLGRIQQGSLRVVKPLGRIVCYFSSPYPSYRAKFSCTLYRRFIIRGDHSEEVFSWKGQEQYSEMEQRPDEQPHHADKMNHHRQQLRNVNHIAIDLEQ